MPELFKTTPTIQFTDEILSYRDTYFLPGMRAQLFSIEMVDESTDTVKISFNVHKFDEWNRQFEPVLDIDTNDDHIVTYYHPKYNHVDPWIESIRIRLDDSDKYIRVIDDSAVALYEAYKSQNNCSSYVEWLEEIVIGTTDLAPYIERDT